MAKIKSTSKTNVSARQAEKNKAKICKYCGKNVDSVRILHPNGRVTMVRKCCDIV